MLDDAEVELFGGVRAQMEKTECYEIDSAFSGSKYAGYVSAGEQIASRSNATGATADTITIANRVSIDYGAQAGDYTDTITYTVTPNYN